MKVYKGKRFGKPDEVGEVQVTVDGKSLIHHAKHSPTGFEWGYGGSGPSDLARCILIDFFSDTKLPAREADKHYQRFKANFVAGWKRQWQITSDEIDVWLKDEAEAKFAGV